MKLSDYPGSPRQTVPNRTKFVPFTAFLKVTPIKNPCRQAVIHDLQKMATTVEDALSVPNAICAEVTSGVSFDFASPVGYTPQFGNQTARVTVHGNACGLSTFTTMPINPNTIDNCGEAKTGYGNASYSFRTPSTILDSLCKSLKHNIERVTGLSVYRMEIAGVIYGFKGFHFPL